MNAPTGCAATTLPNGVRLLAMHYTADEDKRGGWSATVRQGTDPREWDREMELSESTWEGQPVYASYRDEWHAPRKFRCDDRIPRVVNSLYFGGWDCGQTLTPAFVLVQVTPRPFQVHALLEVTSDGGESMEQFAPRVIANVMSRLPGEWTDVRHFGDQTVIARNGSNGRTAQEEAQRHGVTITPVSNTWAPRLSAVTWLLGREINETTPGFILDAGACPLLRKGFQGAYRYKTSAAGDSVGAGAVLLEPAKNMYSHIHDALQYPAIKIRDLVEGTGTRFHK